ncbi:transglycosylase domain-containing protein [Microcella sp.]|uniref:transglycosylase domain-containing protein n=1 Tax=Microcella sp. TaxID=1913979 RepID=UPI00256E36AD|nr:transglycosylase domain-containing protein [Microcella sp.]MBX9471744.1 transglycosylase domain-containing protein [Microcella sp.]
MSAQNQKASGVIGAIAGMLGLSALAGVLVTVMVTPALAVTGMAASNTIGIFEGLPEYIRINEQTQRNAIYAANSNNPDDGYTQIATVFAENREEVEWDAVSQYIKDATLAGEDRRFYDHGGVDMQSIIRAGLGNLTSGGIESGASTLTMQLVKNIFITEALKADTIEERDALIAQAQEQSLERKLKEAKLAIGLEKEYTKDEILLAYLNIAGFGGNTYGIQAASQQYFGIPASDVTIAQAASLVAIVQQPGARSLGSPDNYEANQARRDVILRSMGAEGFITDAEMREALNTPVDENFVTPTAPRNGCIAAGNYAKQFCDYIVKNVKNFESLGETEQERLDNWKLGGYDVYTTMNLQLQVVTQDRLRGVVPTTSTILDIGSVATSVEAKTGRILTMAQNRPFDDSLEGAANPNVTAINYATDREYGGSSGFQTGSTYKIFGLVAWLQEGRGLNEIVDASRFELNQAAFLDTCDDGGGPWGGKWEFKNSGGGGGTAMSVFNATVNSVNSAYASIGEQLDQCAIRGAAESLGVHRADGNPLQTNPSAILGTNEIAPLTMASAFAAIGNGGIYCEPIAVDRFVDRDGNELEGQQPDCRRAITAEVAAAAAAPMASVITGGTATRSRIGDGVPIIGKTGSTDSYNQTWMVGTTTEVATAVWVGNVTGRVSMLRYPSGSALRHEIFRPVMAAANAVYGGAAFPAPPARLQTGSGVQMPDLAGQTQEQAKALLEGLGFRFEVGGQVDSALPEGVVAGANYAPGTLLARGMTVKVTISRGNLINLPSVVGLDIDTAISTLNDAGFTNLGEVCAEIPPEEEGGDPELDGIVTQQSPSGGSKVKYETGISLTVARLDCS